MDNPKDNKIFDNEDLNDPIPLDNDFDKPIPFDDSDLSDTDISHAPLSLGDTSMPSTPSIKKKSMEKVVSTDKITRIKTFYTKLHTGSIDYIDGQINDWLNKNPDVIIKQTNTVTGMVVGKKTEPNIIITVWY